MDTPVKTITRLQLTPSTKEYICIICGESIPKREYRLRLFHKDKKNFPLSFVGEAFESFSVTVCLYRPCM